jgi:hypothetical protein
MTSFKLTNHTKFAVIFAALAFAQHACYAAPGATTNGAGSTSVGIIIAAGDDGDVGTGRKLAAMTKEPTLDPIFSKCGNIQAAYSNLIPFNNKSATRSIPKIRSQNAEQLKTISGIYLCVQKEIPTLIVDILPILVRGETELPVTSVPFAKSVVEELVRNNVQNVYFAHQPVNPPVAGAAGVKKS